MDDNHSLVNNGPWTKEEHEKFLKALEKYGNLSSGSELSKMASEIGNGRTVTDVWKHAEKYLLKLQRAKTQATQMAASISTRRRPRNSAVRSRRQ